jgi:hypothetical protein
MRDHGGIVGEYATQELVYFRERREVRIKGVCNSACTMALGLPTVCIYPQARLGFHLPRYEFGKDIPVQLLGPDTPETRLLWAVYPEGIRTRLGSLSTNMRYLSGSEAIAAGIRACPE